MTLEAANPTPKSPVKKTEKPQPETSPPESRLIRMRRESFAKLEKAIKLQEDPRFYDQLRAKQSSDYDTCFLIAKSIAEGVSGPLQYEYYSQLRVLLAYHPRAKELTYIMTLAWYDYHYNEAPSKLLTELTLMEIPNLPKDKEALSLALSLLQSGYTSQSSHEELRQAVREIMERREAFRQRQVAGQGVSVLSLEDEKRFSAQDFLNLAKKVGSEVMRINEETSKNFKNSFIEAIAKSDPNKPLTLVLTVHGMAQDGGYIALPNNQRLTATEFAEALKKRGNAKNVTILSTQCLPRSSRSKDSFYDNLRKECLKHDIGVPMVYMESMEDQPAILTPRTNPDYKVFQTLRHVADKAKNKKTVTGADILAGSEEVVGNQPSLIIPPQEDDATPLNNDLAYSSVEQSFRAA